MQTAGLKSITKNNKKRLCIHVLHSGEACKAPAVTGSPRCRHHQPAHGPARRMALAATAARNRKLRIAGAKLLEMLRSGQPDLLQRQTIRRFAQNGYLDQEGMRTVAYGLGIYSSLETER